MPAQPTQWQPTAPPRSWTIAKAAAPAKERRAVCVERAAGVVEREGLQGGACRVEKRSSKPCRSRGQELEPSSPVGWGLPPKALGSQATCMLRTSRHNKNKPIGKTWWRRGPSGLAGPHAVMKRVVAGTAHGARVILRNDTPSSQRGGNLEGVSHEGRDNALLPGRQRGPARAHEPVRGRCPEAVTDDTVALLAPRQAVA